MTFTARGGCSESVARACMRVRYLRCEPLGVRRGQQTVVCPETPNEPHVLDVAVVARSKEWRESSLTTPTNFIGPAWVLSG